MDISAATTLAAGIVALVAPALVQAFKKYIPADYVGLTSLGVSILLGVITIAATNGFHGYGWGIRPHRSHRRGTGRLHARQPGVRRQAEQGCCITLVPKWRDDDSLQIVVIPRG